MKGDNRFPAVLCLIFATTAWGGLFHVGKYALNHLDPFWFTSTRYLFAAVFLALILWLLKIEVRWPLLHENWSKLASLGLLGYGFFGILVFIGLNLSVASHGAVVMATMPITALFISWLLDGKKPEWWAFVVGLTALAGVSMIAGAWKPADQGSLRVLFGDSIAFVGTIGWILYSRGQKSFANLSVVEYTSYTTFLAFPFIIALAAMLSAAGPAQIPQPDDLINGMPALIYIVIFATVLSGLAYNRGVRELGVHQGILFINLVPVSAWLISIFMGQYPSHVESLGTALVIASLVIQSLMTGRYFQPAYSQTELMR